MGSALEWASAANRIGDNVLEHCPRWMIFVEGVGTSPGSPGLDNAVDGIWPGENLGGVIQAPILLRDQTKLVYSPHTWGPAMANQKYFHSPIFPDNLADIWAKRFGFGKRPSGLRNRARRSHIVDDINGVPPFECEHVC
jgi:endoglucanase